MHGILVLTADQVRADRDGWLDQRNTGIGASEIAAALGISPWDSPFSLYWRKKLNSHVEMNEAMEWGLRHETTIAAKFAENHPELTLVEGGLFRHPEHEWMLATPDRIAGDTELVQIKTGHSLDEWGDPGTDQIPLHYKAQVIWEMDVMGATRCHVPVLVRGNTYREYVVDFDTEDAATMRKAGAEFMRRLADNDPPDLDGSAATTSTLKALHPDLIDESVTVPVDLADLWWQRKQLLDTAQADYDETTNRMRAAVGNFRYGVAGGRKVAVRSVYDTTRVSGERLKADHPDIYADYSSTSTTNKISPVKETP